jgi:hypothetical protein
MKILPAEKLYRATMVYGAVDGGVSSSPAEVGSTLPKLPMGRTHALEHPVLPSSTVGGPAVVPRVPTNWTNLLTAAPL